MRLRRFEIRSFKGIEQASLDWDDIVVLIGENNSGKSSVLQALELFLGGSQARDEALFFNRLADGDHAIELVGFFDQLGESERQAQAVRGRMVGDEWVLKKTFWSEQADGEAGRASPWKEQYFSLSAEERFAGWPSPDTSWAQFPAEYQPLIADLPGRGRVPSAETRAVLRDLVRGRRPDLVQTMEPSWVQNPGGGGNWKSNANHIIPRLIFVRAVHDASDEAISKEASTYGKIVDLIIERKLMRHPEVQKLREQIEVVLDLFRPNPHHPERQAQEIRELQDRINHRLNEVIGGIASISTEEPDIRPVLLPSTTLVVRDSEEAVDTPVVHQGHGLQRTLIMALLQVLLESQAEPEASADQQPAGDYESRPVVLGIEEPELYMHPQMQRKMRDALYRLASETQFQVICTTHSPVFLDMAQRHKSIVRVVKQPDRRVGFFQVTEDWFAGEEASGDKDRLALVARFHPTVNEIFFAKRVVLLEEQTAIGAFERAAELTGVFERYPAVRRDATLVNCQGKENVPMFQRVLNYFRVPYTVIHDEDRGNATAQRTNQRIEDLLGRNERYVISPTDLEGMLGYAASKDKPYKAIKRVEELHSARSLPHEFLQAMNWVYFGQDSEPLAR